MATRRLDEVTAVLPDGGAIARSSACLRFDHPFHRTLFDPIERLRGRWMIRPHMRRTRRDAMA
ncbi:hypothetical protein K2Z84_13465 [Candidatus Binatia bacterium]|nr:hypothetical protein [Candidatus Binatia bacterium]